MPGGDENMNQNGSTSPVKIRAKFAHKKKKTDSDLVPDLPRLDTCLTVSTILLFVLIAGVLVHEGSVISMFQLILSCCVTVVLIRSSKFFFSNLGKRIGHKEAIEKPRNLRKFADQGWQLTIHTFMSILEVVALSQIGWRWWHDPSGVFSEEAMKPIDGLAQWVYMSQCGIWFVTAFSHKFWEAKHKDYFVMFAHHVATLVLIITSYVFRYHAIGLMVLYVHDVSDIPLDVMKMANYLGLDSTSGFFITEVTFVGTLLSWGYYRLYILPAKLTHATIFYADHLCPTGFLHSIFGRAITFCNFERFFLTVLVCMHCWWYYLLIRIAIRLLSKEKAKDVGADEYEGASSDSERED